MQFFLHKKSFTLIEMLIVIVIIGILAAALVPRLQDVQARARDTKRKADIKSIATALEIYLLDYGKYPSAHASTPNSYNNSSRRSSIMNDSLWFPTLSGYLASVPKDPLNTTGDTNDYTYSHESNYFYTYLHVYNPENTGIGEKVWTYDLVMRLENPKDPERNEIKRYFYVNNTLAYSTGSIPHKMVFDYSPNVLNSTY